MKKIQLVYILLFITALLSACDEHGDPQGDIVLNDAQKAAVSMRGKWSQASDVKLPFGTTPTVLDELVLDFRIDDDYTPSKFSAQGAPYFFDGEDGAWAWSGDSFEAVSLLNILPVTNIQVLKEGHSIRLSFAYNGPAGGRASGVGEYGVTLNKIAP